MVSTNNSNRYFNLLGTLPEIKRDTSARVANKDKFRMIASQFGRESFDGERTTGYGGYRYDGRWVSVAKRLVDKFGLNAGSKVLDIGCAKGFLVSDLVEFESINAFGLDISSYAISNSPQSVASRLACGDMRNLPYADNDFDAVVCINTLHNLSRDEIPKALREMRRVLKRETNCFIQVDSYRTAAEKADFEDWMLTAKTYLTPDQWLNLFDENQYRGYYFWTIFSKE